MNMRKTTRKTLASHEPSAQGLAELERRLDEHEEILSFLTTILDQLKERRFRLALTDEQHAELNRWLGKYEKKPKNRPSRLSIN